VTDLVGHDDGLDGLDRVRFVPVVRLSKEEVFAACQALADADRCLVRAGHHREAHALGDLFERFESQLTGTGAYSVAVPDPPAVSDSVACSGPCPGWYSSESELMQ
jgi:hypothetical protein